MTRTLEEEKALDLEVVSLVADETGIDVDTILRVVRVYNAVKHLPSRLRLEEEGGHWGRPVSMTESQVQRVLDLRLRGRSIRYIAREVGMPKSTVYRALTGRGVYAAFVANGGAGAGKRTSGEFET